VIHAVKYILLVGTHTIQIIYFLQHTVKNIFLKYHILKHCPNALLVPVVLKHVSFWRTLSKCLIDKGTLSGAALLQFPHWDAFYIRHINKCFIESLPLWEMLKWLEHKVANHHNVLIENPDYAFMHQFRWSITTWWETWTRAIFWRLCEPFFLHRVQAWNPGQYQPNCMYSLTSSS